MTEYRDWLNQTNYILSQQDRDSIDYLSQELSYVHEENLRLAGENAVWLSRKMFGTPCSNRDDAHGRFQDVVSRCQLCYGTGYLGGYEVAVTIPISFIPSKEIIDITNVGLAVLQQPIAWTKKTDPAIKERDIIILTTDITSPYGSVYKKNTRFYIASATRSEVKGLTRYQEMVLDFPEISDIIYDIPISGTIGEKYNNLKCTMTINPFKQDLICTMEIFNYWWI